MIEQLPEDEWRDARQASGERSRRSASMLNVQRGELDEAARIVSLFEELESSADLQEQALYACGKAKLRLAERDLARRCASPRP